MLENRLRSLLENALGEYLELDQLGVCINIWKSEKLCLKNVKFKQSIISANLPFQLKYGVIGELRADIPFSSIGTKPSKVVLQDVNVELTPRIINVDNKANIVDAVVNGKVYLLQRDRQARKTLDSEESDKHTSTDNAGYFGLAGYFDKLISRVLSKLDLEIRNLRITYSGFEFGMSANESPSCYSLNLKAEAIYMEATDHTWTTNGWNPAASRESNSIPMYKLFQCFNCSLYMKKSCEKPSCEKSNCECDGKFEPNAHHFSTKGRSQKQYQSTILSNKILVPPLNGILKLQILPQDSDIAASYQYSGTLGISNLTVFLDECQLKLVALIVDQYISYLNWYYQIMITTDSRTDSIAMSQFTRYLTLWSDYLDVDIKKYEAKSEAIVSELEKLEQNFSSQDVLALRNFVWWEAETRINASICNRMIKIGKFAGHSTDQLTFLMLSADHHVSIQVDNHGQFVVAPCKDNCTNKLHRLIWGLVLCKVNSNSMDQCKSISDAEAILENAAFPQIFTCTPPAGMENSMGLMEFKVNTPTAEIKLVSYASHRCFATVRLDETTATFYGSTSWFSSLSIECQELYFEEMHLFPSSSCLLSTVRPRDQAVIDNYPEHRKTLISIELFESVGPRITINLSDLVLVLDRKKMMPVVNYISAWYNMLWSLPNLFIVEVSELKQYVGLQSESTLEIFFLISSLQIYVAANSTSDEQSWVRKRDKPCNFTLPRRFKNADISVRSTPQPWNLAFHSSYQTLYAIIILQSRFRGRVARRDRIPNLSKCLNSFPFVGWLYIQNDDLFYLRWDRILAVCDEREGSVKFYLHGSVSSYLFSILGNQIECVQYEKGNTHPEHGRLDTDTNLGNKDNSLFSITMDVKTIFFGTDSKAVCQQWVTKLRSIQENGSVKAFINHKSVIYPTLLNFTSCYVKDKCHPTWILIKFEKANVIASKLHIDNCAKTRLILSGSIEKVLIQDCTKRSIREVLYLGKLPLLQPKEGQENGISFAGSFVGDHAIQGIDDTQVGLSMSVTTTGRIFFPEFLPAVYSLLQEFALLYPDEIYEPVVDVEIEPFIVLSKLFIVLKLGYFEVYVEDSVCAAKISSHSLLVQYNAVADNETLELAIGFTNLFALTTEVSMRLLSVSDVCLAYEMKLLETDHANRKCALTTGNISIESDKNMSLLSILRAYIAPVESAPTSNKCSSNDVCREYNVMDGGKVSAEDKATGRKFVSLFALQSFASFGCYDQGVESSSWTLFNNNCVNVHDEVSVKCNQIVLEIVKPSLSLVSLDTYLPVLKLSFSNCFVELASKSNIQTDFYVSSGIEILGRYYNSALAEWEPAIEPWHVYSTLVFSERDGIFIDMKALQRLNINFTESLVNLICSLKQSDGDHRHGKHVTSWRSDKDESSRNGMVCVLNNLGVPVRLANLNTSTSGTLTVTIKDAWSLPHYTRFKNAHAEVSLLPWSNPKKSANLHVMSNSFELKYAGAQPGVAPKLKISISTIAHKIDTSSARSTTSQFEVLQHHKLFNSRENKLKQLQFCGSTEISLVGKLSKETRFDRVWYRLVNAENVICGEVLVSLRFTPSSSVGQPSDLPQVEHGSYFTFDPLLTVESKPPTPGDLDNQQSYCMPPLALEIRTNEIRSDNLLCPLERAGKFLVQGGGEILVEVKVAQRDEVRRVVLLSSPVQFKNGSRIDVVVWWSPIGNAVARSSPITSTTVKPRGKVSIPLSALYGDSRQLIVLQVENSEPTLLTAEETLTGGSHLLYLHPQNGQLWGYCFFVNTVAQTRDIYRENASATVSGSQNPTSDQNSNRDGLAMKYQIRLYSCLEIENALPVRLQFEIRTSCGVVFVNGTLSSGQKVLVHEFTNHASIYFRIPSLNSEWCAAINQARCISTNGSQIHKSRVTQTDSPNLMVEELKVNFYAVRNEKVPIFESACDELHLFTARLSFAVADTGGPSIVLYAALWLYNQSHVSKLLFKDSSSEKSKITVAPKILTGRPVPTLMDCKTHSFQLATIFGDDISQWSDKLHATTAGVRGSIVLKSHVKSDSVSRKDVAIAIRRPSGIFHRSAQIVITPRFVFVNHTNAEFQVRQAAGHAGYSNGIAIDIPQATLHAPTPFDYDLSHGRSVSLRLKLQGSKWSGSFDIDEEREFPLRLRRVEESRVASREPLIRIRIKISSIGATTVISLLLDDPPLFMLQNNSSFNFQYRQSRTHDAAECLATNSNAAFGWDKPCAVCEIVGRFFAETPEKNYSPVQHYDFEQLDRSAGEVSIWLGDSDSKTVVYEIVVQGTSRILKFADAKISKKTKYTIDINAIAARLFDEKIPRVPVYSKICVACNGTNQTTSTAILERKKFYRYNSNLEFQFSNRPKEVIIQFVDINAAKSSVSVAKDSTAAPALNGVNDPTACHQHPVGLREDEMSSPECLGSIKIKLPKRVWASTSHRSAGTINPSSESPGVWWTLTSAQGVKIVDVQLVMQFHTVKKPKSKESSMTKLRLSIPSIGVSFIHNSNMLEVAYFSLQRVQLLWSQKSGTSEIALAVGNIQLDNQIDEKVVLAPAVSAQTRKGASIHLRDRWKKLLTVGYRGFGDGSISTSRQVLQFRMLWHNVLDNAEDSPGIVHVELIETVMQELEIFVDEKFVVNLIGVFQGFGKLATVAAFNDIVDQSVEYSILAGPIASKNVYIELLDLQSIRIKFNVELNGGRHVAKLGPSGRRLATILPESNVKNFRMHFSQLIFHHVYGSQRTIFSQLYRHYQQQGVIMILKGLYTVTLFVNPFRIVYRLGHGFLAVVRLPARGLASGSPLELISGAYMGVRSLAINTISASYETIAGVSGILASGIATMLPPGRKDEFREDMVGFQRTILHEVDALDSVDHHITVRSIIRKPRIFLKHSVGLLTVYGPGRLPEQDQFRVDLKAAILLQGWWRRRQLMHALYDAAASLRPKVKDRQKKRCSLQ